MAALVLRETTSVGITSTAGAPEGSRKALKSNSAPRCPDSSKCCRTVVRPTNLAISISSYPTTDKSSGTRSPSSLAASTTPIAWVSLAAKIAVGGSAPESISNANR